MWGRQEIYILTLSDGTTQPITGHSPEHVSKQYELWRTDETVTIERVRLKRSIEHVMVRVRKHVRRNNKHSGRRWKLATW